MDARTLKNVRMERRKRRVRRRIFGTIERPRLAVCRSLKHISAQLIDDVSGKTLCSAGTKTKALAGQIKNGGNCAAAALVGKHLAEQARMHNIRAVAFDRSGRRYHGRIKALAEAARKTGLEF